MTAPVPSEPLNVRVARALGQRAARKEDEGDCFCYQGERHAHDPIHYPPYGSDTPEGWAVTGPFIGSYKLYLSPDECHPGKWLAFALTPDGEDYREAQGDNASAAVAEFVAKFGGPDGAR